MVVFRLLLPLNGLLGFHLSFFHVVFMFIHSCLQPPNHRVMYQVHKVDTMVAYKNNSDDL